MMTGDDGDSKLPKADVETRSLDLELPVFPVPTEEDRKRDESEGEGVYEDSDCTIGMGYLVKVPLLSTFVCCAHVIVVQDFAPYNLTKVLPKEMWQAHTQFLVLMHKYNTIGYYASLSCQATAVQPKKSIMFGPKTAALVVTVNYKKWDLLRGPSKQMCRQVTEDQRSLFISCPFFKSSPDNVLRCRHQGHGR